MFDIIVYVPMASHRDNHAHRQFMRPRTNPNLVLVRCHIILLNKTFHISL